MKFQSVPVNRKERRLADKQAKERYQAMPEFKKRELLLRSQTRAEIQRNGITEQMLKDSIEKAYNQGFKDGADPKNMRAYNVCFASMCHVLHKHYGFEAKELKEMLNEIDRTIIEDVVTTTEFVEQVFDELHINYDPEELFAERFTLTDKETKQDADD